MKTVHRTAVYVATAASAAYQFAIGFFMTEQFADQLDGKDDKTAARHVSSDEPQGLGNRRTKYKDVMHHKTKGDERS
jgi:hypothetical protein